MSGLIAGLANSGVGLYHALTKQPVQSLQILSQSGDTLIVFDAIMSESMTWNSDVTDKAVEDGSNISDHNIRKPFQNSFVGVVSDSPLHSQSQYVQEGVTTAVSAVAPAFGILGTAAAYALYSANKASVTPSRLAMQQLLLLKNGDMTKLPPTPPSFFSIVNPQGQWDNLQMTELSIAKTPDTDGTLVFACTVKEVRVVRAQSVNVQVLANPGLSSGKVKAGEQTKEDLSDIQKASVTGRFDGIVRMDAVKPEDVGGITN